MSSMKFCAALTSAAALVATFAPAATAATIVRSAAPVTEVAAANPAGRFHPVPQSRVVDSRIGRGLPLGAVKAGSTVSFKATGIGGVPATGVQAVIVNITVINPSATGWLVAYAGGTTKPSTSTVNYPKAWTGATTATVPVGADGRVNITTGGANVQVAIDYLGWYASDTSTEQLGALYENNRPERWYDSRVDDGGTRFAPKEWIDIPISFDESGGARLTAMQFNVTATDGQGNGWFTLYPSDLETAPATSSLNFSRGETSPNLVTVRVARVGTDPDDASRGLYTATLQNTSGSSAHVIVDAVGSYFTDPANIGTVHTTVKPVRIGDSRIGRGMPMGTLKASQTVKLAVPESDAVLAPQTAYPEGVLTLANPTATTYLTLWAGNQARPATSTVNSTAGRNRSNGFVAFPGCITPVVNDTCTPGFNIYNSGGTANVIVDVTGRFDATPEAMAAWGWNASAKSVNAAPRAPRTSGPKLAGAPVRG